MRFEAEPVRGLWYHDADKSQKFKVVDVNSDTGDIKLQYFDGSLDQIDFYIWGTLGAEQIEAPENWSGARDIDAAATDDYAAADIRPEDWANSYDESAEKRSSNPRRSH